jgi:acetyl esterase/lipase
LAGSIAVVLVVFVVVTQALAVVPIGWLTWTLDVQLSQAIVLRLGYLRDGLGVWNVLIAASSAVFALVGFGNATGHRRLEKLLAFTSLLALASTLSTTGVLLRTVGRLGVAAFPPLPTVPFAAVGGRPDHTVTFGKPAGTDLRADLYLPAGNDGKRHAVIVSIHGGGFAFGGRGPTAYTRFLADHGYAVMDIDYRLATQDSPTWNTAVADVGCALTWITAHAGEYGMDPDRVATLGASAGGNLAINASYMANGGTLEPACGKATDLPQVRAAIGGYPAIDLTRGTRATAIGRLVGQYIGTIPRSLRPNGFSHSHQRQLSAHPHFPGEPRSSRPGSTGTRLCRSAHRPRRGEPVHRVPGTRPRLRRFGRRPHLCDRGQPYPDIAVARNLFVGDVTNGRAQPNLAKLQRLRARPALMRQQPLLARQSAAETRQ